MESERILSGFLFMSKALRAIVERLGNQAGVVCCAVLLDLPARHPDADGLDAAGRSVFLVGKHFFGEGPAAEIATQTILNQLKDGHVSDACHVIVMAPKASDGIARAIEADHEKEEILLHGPRGTGKTHALAAAAIINAELHLRAGFHGPFKVSWLHDSIKSASSKTAESLKHPLWGGLWTIKEDNTRPIFSLAGQELVRGDFIGCRDEQSAQRLRQDAHMILAEELIASMTDGLGITQEEWELARSSAIRLETRRRSALAATNPGSPDLWPAPYFGVTQPTLPTRTAVAVPITDRMTPEQQAVHNQTFAGTTSMHRRLGKGEWVMAEMGSAVAEGFDASVHVSRVKLVPHPNYLLAIGWDGGHSPSAVMGQNQLGQCQIYAGLNTMKAGVLELIERHVLPWLRAYAPFALQDYGAALVHIIDPNMKTPGQATILESAEKMIRQHLGGRVILGPVRWPPRREAILRALRPAHVGGRVPLLISPGEDTDQLVHALEGRWYYETIDQQVDRTGPEKPNSPWADLGDAAAYLLDWLQGGELMDVAQRDMKVEYGVQWDQHSTVRTEVYHG